jgi:hypothetical protein
VVLSSLVVDFVEVFPVVASRRRLRSRPRAQLVIRC